MFGQWCVKFGVYRYMFRFFHLLFSTLNWVPSSKHSDSKSWTFFWTFWNFCQQDGDPHVANYMGWCGELEYLFELLNRWLWHSLVIQPIPSSTGSGKKWVPIDFFPNKGDFNMLTEVSSFPSSRWYLDVFFSVYPNHFIQNFVKHGQPISFTVCSKLVPTKVLKHLCYTAVSLIIADAETCSCSLHAFQLVYLSLFIWVPGTGCIIRNRMHQCCMCGYLNLFWTEPQVSLDETQYAICFLYCPGDMLVPA